MTVGRPWFRRSATLPASPLWPFALPAALLSLASASAASPNWTPAVNPHASTSLVINLLLLVLLFIARHGFLMLVAGIFGPVVFSKAGLRWKVSLVMALVANLLAGSAVADILLYRFGMAGAATIIGQHETGNQYNDHDVVAYDVLIRKQHGGTITTSFEDDDFNVYPWHNATSYPSAGNVFTVRYLEHFPGYFTILANDFSPWANAVRCGTMQEEVVQAQAKAGFSHDAADAADLTKATQKARDMQCL